MEKYKVAVIGCGTIANSQHLPALMANGDVQIKYCVDLIEDRARLAAETYGAEKYCTDYKQVLKDKDVEFALVLTPNFSHAGISMDFLNAGKHVFCEKPITVDYALSVKMYETAKKAGKMLQIGVCNRYNKVVEVIKNYIDTGMLGEVYHVFCSYRSHRCIPGLGGYFTTKDESGGGVLIDWGVHFIDLILYALDMPKVKTVSANCYNKLGKDIPNYVYNSMWAGPPKTDGICDVEEFVSSYIRTDKCALTMIGAWAQNIGADEMFIDFMGDKAGIRMDYNGMFTMYSVKDGILYTEMPSFVKPNMFDLEQKDFFESARKGVVSRGNIVHVLETAKIMDAIYESDKKNREIAL